MINHQFKAQRESHYLLGNIYGNPDCFILKDRQSRGPDLEFSYSRGASEDVEFSVPGFLLSQGQSHNRKEVGPSC